MRKLFALLGAVALMSLPMAALAQEDGGVSDTGVHVDAAQPDTAVVEDAHVNDSATPSDAAVGVDMGLGEPCGDINYLGVCRGSWTIWCDTSATPPVLVGNDCGEYSEQIGNTVTCGIVDCTDNVDTCWGTWCVSPSGGYCDNQYVMCAGVDGLGCLNGACGTADACVRDTYEPSCAGNTASYCAYGHVATIDCTGGGEDPYVCAADSTGALGCLGTAGGTCDLTSDPPWECSTGFRCNSNSGEGVCVTASADAGRRDSGRRDTGSTGGTDSATGDGGDGGGTCGCSGANAGASAIAIVVAMLGLALIRRR